MCPSFHSGICYTELLRELMGCFQQRRRHGGTARRSTLHKTSTGTHDRLPQSYILYNYMIGNYICSIILATLARSKRKGDSLARQATRYHTHVACHARASRVQAAKHVPRYRQQAVKFKKLPYTRVTSSHTKNHMKLRDRMVVIGAAGTEPVVGITA